MDLIDVGAPDGLMALCPMSLYLLAVIFCKLGIEHELATVFKCLLPKLFTHLHVTGLRMGGCRTTVVIVCTGNKTLIGSNAAGDLSLGTFLDCLGQRPPVDNTEQNKHDNITHAHMHGKTTNKTVFRRGVRKDESRQREVNTTPGAAATEISLSEPYLR